VPLLGFVADFYAPSARLIVEVDGGYHARRVTADARRDRKLARVGYRTLRVSAELATRDLPAVLAAIAATCRQASASVSRWDEWRPFADRSPVKA
jgi:very-short-patch-repair endonuclease